MSIHRHAARVDSAQQPIVDAIEAAGWMAWKIRLPCDLMCWHKRHDIWQPLEVKSVRKKNGEHTQDKRQQAQIEFLETTGTPVVTTPEEAILALARRIDRHLEGR